MDLTLKDDKAPAIDDVEFVKANSNDTKTNVIKVTFDEDLKEDIKKAEEKGIGNDFEIRSNGSYMKVKSVSIGKFTDNKDEAVIVLDKEINIDVTNTTIRLTDNEDYQTADNYNEDGINIADLEGNEADATKAQTITKSEKDSTIFDNIKKADQGVADKAAADKVQEEIAKLPAKGEVKLENKTAIETARKNYNALTEDQKKLVDNEANLKDAEAAIEALEAAEADQAAVNGKLSSVNASYELAKGTDDTDDAKIAGVKAAVEAAIADNTITVSVEKDTVNAGKFKVKLTKNAKEAIKDNIIVTIAS